MLPSLLWCALGLGLLIVAGDKVVDWAASLAARLRIPPGVVALTVVAAGTSFPELFVSGMAAADGAGGIAVGNVLGSNSFNIGFILGVTGLFAPIPTDARVLKVDWPFLLLATLAAVYALGDGHLSRPEAAGLVAGAAAFTLFSVLYAQRADASDETLVAHGTELHVEERGVGWLVVALALGFAALGLGARWFVDGAAGLARGLGWSERLIGLTIVSMGTGAPEVVASIAAARAGRHDMAVANVIGSNVFNALAILGAAGLVAPLEVPDLGADAVVTLAFTALLGPVLYVGNRITRPEAALLLGAYLAYVGWLALG